VVLFSSTSFSLNIVPDRGSPTRVTLLSDHLSFFWRASTTCPETFLPSEVSFDTSYPSPPETFFSTSTLSSAENASAPLADCFFSPTRFLMTTKICFLSVPSFSTLPSRKERLVPPFPVSLPSTLSRAFFVSHFPPPPPYMGGAGGCREFFSLRDSSSSRKRPPRSLFSTPPTRPHELTHSSYPNCPRSPLPDRCQSPSTSLSPPHLFRGPVVRSEVPFSDPIVSQFLLFQGPSAVRGPPCSLRKPKSSLLPPP